MRSARARWTAAILLFAAIVIVAASLGRTGGGAAAGPEGTVALRRFLAAMGADVRSADDPPNRGTFVLLQDLRSGEDAAALLRWVEGGGRLVLADPASETARSLGVEVRSPRSFASGTTTTAAGCAAPTGVRARAIAYDRRDVLLRSSDPRAVACFIAERGSYVLEIPRGAGVAVVVAGRSVFENRLLREHDNAALALAVVRSPVVFGPPVPAGATGAPRGLWATLPVAARVVLVQLGIAFLIFAAVRARRFGKPRPEIPIAPIPASELVRASGRLYRAARASGHAAEVMRAATAERIGKRVGADPTITKQALATIVADRSDVPEHAAVAALTGSTPSGDAELIALARSLEEIAKKFEGGA